MAKISVVGICGRSVFMTVDHFHKDGETLSAESIFEEIGGKGINQAIAASKMGAEVSFLTAVGADGYAAECARLLNNFGIKPYIVEKQGKNTTIAFILTDINGENQVTVHKSAELTQEDVESFRKEIVSSDILLIQNEVPEEVNKKAIEIAFQNNVKVILNPAPAREIDDEVASKIFLAIPNEQEAEFINSKKFKNCIVTLGGNGCLINGETKVRAKKVVPVDTTGAGDTFCGVMAACVAEKMPLLKAAKYAICASGISVTSSHVIDSIPNREEIERNIDYE